MGAGAAPAPAAAVRLPGGLSGGAPSAPRMSRRGPDAQPDPPSDGQAAGQLLPPQAGGADGADAGAGGRADRPRRGRGEGGHGGSAPGSPVAAWTWAPAGPPCAQEIAARRSERTGDGHAVRVGLSRCAGRDVRLIVPVRSMPAPSRLPPPARRDRGPTRARADRRGRAAAREAARAPYFAAEVPEISFTRILDQGRRSSWRT